MIAITVCANLIIVTYITIKMLINAQLRRLQIRRRSQRRSNQVMSFGGGGDGEAEEQEPELALKIEGQKSRNDRLRNANTSQSNLMTIDQTFDQE